MDDESGESMEPMEEVPLKELGETESSSGILDDEDCVFRISGGGSYECCLLSRVLKTNSFRECALGYLYGERRMSRPANARHYLIHAQLQFGHQNNIIYVFIRINCSFKN